MAWLHVKRTILARFGLFISRPCQHDDGHIDGRSQIMVRTDEQTQVRSAQSSLMVTHPSTNRARRYLTSVTESPSKHWSLPRTSFWQGSFAVLELAVT